MDALPPEIVRNVAEMLNPTDRWRLSSSCRQFRELLPVWLRIRVVSPRCHACLKPRFYVSRADEPNKALRQDESLQYEVEYLFWTYDYERENRVYLGRHGQKFLQSDEPHYLYSLGLRPKQANQTWIISQGSENEKGRNVPFESMIGLTVGGKNPKPYRTDSETRLFLSAHTLTMGALWYTLQNKWSVDEELQLVRCSEECRDHNRSQRVEKKLLVHAIPDVLDGGYSLYSPQSMKLGIAACELSRATVRFSYWIKGGMMYFSACNSLDFTFGVPILEEDAIEDDYHPATPLNVLLRKNSSRWWAIKLYMSTAADVAEGHNLQMDFFLRVCKDHEDHTIVHDAEEKLVHIDVRDAIPDKRFPDIKREDNGLWKFLLCG